MVWDLGDVRNMKYQTDRFDVVFDKGLLDNLQCYLEAEEVCAAGLKDMHRVLKPGGKFLLLSCHAPDELAALLKNSGNALPLAPATKTVAVIGPNANLSKADTSYYGPRAACGNNYW